MKKFTVLLMFLACASFLFAQTKGRKAEIASPDSRISKEIMMSKTMSLDLEKTERDPSAKDGDSWTMDFEGGIDWEMGNLLSSSTKRFVVSDAATAIQSGGLEYYLSRELLDVWFEESNFAWIDVIADNTQFGGTGHENTEAYMLFRNINIQNVINAKLRFYHAYYRLNRVNIYVDWSNDEGSTWHTTEILPTLPSNELVRGYTETLLLGDNVGDPGAGGSRNLWLRFRWKTTAESASGPYGYFWLIDNIEIMESLPYDVRLEDYRVNFFQYIDYHTEPRISTNDGSNLNFQYSSHYGHIPQSLAAGNDAILAFNGVIKNVGSESVTPALNVKVYKEGNEGSPLFEKTVASPNVYPPDQIIDTIDIWGTDNFTIPSDIETGKYIVRYEAMIQGHEDGTPANNVREATFYITNNTFSRDSKRITTSMGPSDYVGGDQNNSQMSIVYDFPTVEDIKGIDIFIADISDPGTNLRVELSVYDPTTDQYEVREADNIDIEPEDVGNWISTRPFTSNVNVPAGADGFGSVELILTFYFNGDELKIGADDSNKVSTNGVYFNMGDQWYIGSGSAVPAVRLRTVSAVEDPPAEIIPELRGRAPIADERNVALNAQVIAEFNVDVEITATAENITIVDAESNPVANVEAVLNAAYPKRLYVDHADFALNTRYTVNIPAGSVQGYDTDLSWSFSTSRITGIPEIITGDGISIYPNPTSGMVKIENAKGATIEVLNYMGQIVNRIDNANEYQEINISNLSNGNYFIRIVMDGNVSVEKLNLVK